MPIFRIKQFNVINTFGETCIFDDTVSFVVGFQQWTPLSMRGGHICVRNAERHTSQPTTPLALNNWWPVSQNILSVCYLR